MLTLVIPACGAGITACGARQAPRRAPTVELQLRAPTDGTRVQSSSITVSGTVSPARAGVRVFGRPAPVRPDGSFSTRVPLRDGVNLIDVMASLPHASGAMSAVRVERYVLVAVPPVLGQTAGDAEAALRAAGLVPKPQSADSAFESLLPLPDQVCAASPGPGTEVAPGSAVTLSTAKVCGVSGATSAPEAPPAHQQPAPKPAAHPAPPPPRSNGQGPDGLGPPGQLKKQGDQGNQNSNGD